jgi:hypothetical protein
MRILGILGLIVFMVDASLISNRSFRSYHLVRIFFSIMVVCWSAIFLDMWKRRERMFGIRYGGEGVDIHTKKGEGTGDDTRRPGFRGEYRRALWNNDMNHKEYPNEKRIKPIIISCLISFALLCVSVGFTLLILYLKGHFYAKYSPLEENPLAKLLLTMLPPVLNFTVAKNLIKIHTKIAT